MEWEEFISGYCRNIDGSRMVAAEFYDGELTVDCCYGSCPYERECTVARRIRELTEA